MARVILGIGGNSGDRLENLMLAGGLIYDRLGKIVIFSPIIQSEPWGFQSENKFLNQVLVVETEARPDQLLKVCLGIETQFGRQRTGEYSDRRMDIDILFYDDMIISEEELTIPHPRLQERLFVLKPLASICPEFIHPVSGLTIKELLKSCDDNSETSWFKGSYSLPLLP